MGDIWPFIILALMLIGFVLKFFKDIREDEMTKSKKNPLISGQRERIENQVYYYNKILLEDKNRLFDSAGLVLSNPEKDLSISSSIPNCNFFRNLGIDVDNVKIENHTALCLMPFNKRFDKIYGSICVACKIAGFTCLRSDNNFISGNLLRQIVQLIFTSQVIVAVLDGKNPNVFYEIGIAHSIGKTVILIANLADVKDIPFNLKSDRLLLYSSHRDLQERLARTLKHTYYAE